MRESNSALYALKNAGMDILHAEYDQTAQGFMFIRVFIDWPTAHTQKVDEALKTTEWRRMNTFMFPDKPSAIDGKIHSGVFYVTLFQVKDLDALGAGGLR